MDTFRDPKTGGPGTTLRTPWRRKLESQPDDPKAREVVHTPILRGPATSRVRVRVRAPRFPAPPRSPRSSAPAPPRAARPRPAGPGAPRTLRSARRCRKAQFGSEGDRHHVVCLSRHREATIGRWEQGPPPRAQPGPPEPSMDVSHGGRSGDNRAGKEKIKRGVEGPASDAPISGGELRWPR
uniref:uncharacterized protein LOC113184756 n=1 Tax=Urocitellus parryii TaxID=9999 RepID=UPI000E55B6ED|nr:uncharacterized protein LOC113184756 [Urocitellus parryii]